MVQIQIQVTCISMYTVHFEISVKVINMIHDFDLNDMKTILRDDIFDLTLISSFLGEGMGFSFENQPLFG